jgi:hypothetical protein
MGRALTRCYVPSITSCLFIWGWLAGKAVCVRARVRLRLRVRVHDPGVSVSVFFCVCVCVCVCVSVHGAIGARQIRAAADAAGGADESAHRRDGEPADPEGAHGGPGAGSFLHLM